MTRLMAMAMKRMTWVRTVRKATEKARRKTGQTATPTTTTLRMAMMMR